ncbi:MAG: hypothetical protein ABI675_02555 [Chitinophagaceae bacterium]
MLRKLLFVSLAVATLASCKKDKSDAPAYNLSVKVDGTKADFNTAVVAQKTGDASTGFTVAISGIGGTASSPYPSFSLLLDDDASITTKTYTAAADDITGIYQAASGQATFASDNDFTIVITSITATDVKGTFSGKVEDGSGGIKAITEGTFTARFQ